MRTPFLLLALVVAVLATALLFVRPTPTPPPVGPGDRTPTPTPPTPPAAGGKLVVLVVFDQMRGDYLTRWAAAFGKGGFERLKAGGTWYADCHIPYACTSTGPGHASIVTGVPPGVHGIVENDWYEPGKGAIYCAQPEREWPRVPPIPATAPPARGSALGFSPDRLLAPTVGDAVKAAGGRVFALSIKDRTVAMMGGKRPDGAYCFDARDGVFHTGGYYADRVHPWVAAFNADRVVDREKGKPWDRLRADVELYARLSGPDDAPGEGRGYDQGRIFPHPLGGERYYSAFECSPAGNDAMWELAERAIAAENLGRAGASDLLCVSFSSNDLIGHQWGPDSQEVLDVTLRSDALVGRMVDFLDARLGRDGYTLVVTSDHGVSPIPEQAAARHPGATRVMAADALTGLSAAVDEVFGKPGDGQGAWVGVVEWPWLYLNENLLAARKVPADKVAEYVAQWVGNRGWAEAAFTRKQIEANDFKPGRTAELGAMVRLAYHPQRSGDVIAIPKAYSQVTAYPTGTGHGTPHAYDTHVPLLVFGGGVEAKGRRDGRVSSLAAAAILAKAAGVAAPPGAAPAP